MAETKGDLYDEYILAPNQQAAEDVQLSFRPSRSQKDFLRSSIKMRQSITASRESLPAQGGGAGRESSGEASSEAKFDSDVYTDTLSAIQNPK